MKLAIYTVDAFTSVPFSGNPAAVVLLKQPLEETVLQSVAAELNLSETAYIQPEGSEDDPWQSSSCFSLRWFTPTNEVPLCGHATLAAAHVLFTCQGNDSEQLHFKTLSGLLVARRHADKIILDFPANLPEPLTPQQELKLSAVVKTITGNLPVQSLLLSPSTKKLLVRLNDSCTRKELESLEPNSEVLLGLHDGSLVKGVIVSLRSDSPGDDDKKEVGTNKYHCLSRYFAPWNGIPEDPVTGSAHTVLGPYWSKELGILSLNCRQCSPRGGDVVVGVRTDGRIDLAGQATTLIEGYINI